MKSKRHAKILELIADYPIDTQEELLKKLNESGFYVTQATVSRDIKELRLIKSQSSNGGYYYTTGAKEMKSDISYKFNSIFFESVNGIDYASNFVVIKCYTGMANAVCAAMDAIHWKGVVGTLAGDDTIFVLMRDEQGAAELCSQFKKLMNR